MTVTRNISNSVYFDHGCQNWATVEKNKDGQWIVTEVNSCHSCWQVGHDRDYIYYNIGDIVPNDVVEECEER